MQSIPASKWFYSNNSKKIITVAFAKKIAKMTEICTIKLQMICVLRPKFWPGHIFCLYAYVNFLIKH